MQRRPLTQQYRPGSLRPFLSLLAVFAALGLSGSLHAAEGPTPGRVIPIPNPITSQTVTSLKRATDRVIKDFERTNTEKKTLVLVFDFNNQQALDGASFGACYELSRVIHDLNARASLQIYGFIHDKVTGHAVLAALACPRLLFTDDGELGPIAPGEEARALQADKIINAAYQEAARWRWSNEQRASELYQALFSPDQQERIFKLSNDQSMGKLGSAEKPQGKQEIKGLPGLLDHLGLSKDSLLSLLPENPIVCQILVQDPVNGALQEKLPRLLRSAIHKHEANLIVLDLRCQGGDLARAYALAKKILEIKKDAGRPFQLVAYYSKEAKNTALYLALACDEIILHKEAKLGEFDDLLSGENLSSYGEQMNKLAVERSQPANLLRAFVDKTSPEMQRIAIERRGRLAPRFFNSGQLDDAPNDPPAVRAEKAERRANSTPIWNANDGKLLVLDADKAEAYGLTSGSVDKVEDIYANRGLDSAKVIHLKEDWLDQLARFLSSDWASFLLIMVGITCLILELKMPGVGLPGVLAALCFVLFFWSHSKFNGEITWLAILLFILGLLLLALEIFVLPGFGIPGISGLILALSSLGLMAYGRWPQSGTEWIGFSKELTPYGFSLMGAIVAAIILARYLPNLPYFNRLVLKPQIEAEGFFDEELDPHQARLAALLGAIGVASTPLRPAGKVQFGEEFVDVVAEGSYIVPGSRVQVIEIEGNRVVVKQV